MPAFSLYTDGGARGNPGPAASGAVLMENGKMIARVGKYLGSTTNNQAEYSAILIGLQKAKELGIGDISCYMDSELAVKQLRLEYKVKNKALAPLFLRVWNLSQQFRRITFTHVPREQNKEADSIVNEILDKHENDV